MLYTKDMEDNPNLFMNTHQALACEIMKGALRKLVSLFPNELRMDINFVVTTF